MLALRFAWHTRYAPGRPSCGAGTSVGSGAYLTTHDTTAQQRLHAAKIASVEPARQREEADALPAQLALACDAMVLGVLDGALRLAPHQPALHRLHVDLALLVRHCTSTDSQSDVCSFLTSCQERG